MEAGEETRIYAESRNTSSKILITREKSDSIVNKQADTTFTKRRAHLLLIFLPKDVTSVSV